MQIMDYIKPELLAVALVLYFIGIGLKRSQTIQNRYVPGVLGSLRQSCRESWWRDLVLMWINCLGRGTNPAKKRKRKNDFAQSKVKIL